MRCKQRSSYGARDVEDACLGVAHAPVAQGDDAAASGVAMRKWFCDLVTRVNPDALVKLASGDTSMDCFHRLDTAQFATIANALSTRQMQRWSAGLDTAGLSAGRFYAIAATEDGSITATQITLAPFL